MGKRLLACMLLGLTLAGGGAAAAGPVIEKARGGTCVDVPEVMRRMHPDLLKHQRDETVHRGVRDARASLKGCVDCHAGAQSGSVATAKTDFCVSCHSFAAVKVDCFQCHASRPGQAAAPHALVEPRAGAGLESLVARRRELDVGGILQR